MRILNLLQQKHAEYVDKYGTYPDLLFVGYTHLYAIYIEIGVQNSFSRHQWLNNQAFLGCKIIKVFDPHYEYDFYEYEDLNTLADCRYSADLEYINHSKLPSLFSAPYNNGSDLPIEPIADPIITVPIQVIESFRQELKLYDLYSDMKKVQGIYQDWLRMHSHSWSK